MLGWAIWPAGAGSGQLQGQGRGGVRRYDWNRRVEHPGQAPSRQKAALRPWIYPQHLAAGLGTALYV